MQYYTCPQKKCCLHFKFRFIQDVSNASRPSYSPMKNVSHSQMKNNSMIPVIFKGLLYLKKLSDCSSAWVKGYWWVMPCVPQEHGVKTEFGVKYEYTVYIWLKTHITCLSIYIPVLNHPKSLSLKQMVLCHYVITYFNLSKRLRACCWLNMGDKYYQLWPTASLLLLIEH